MAILDSADKVLTDRAKAAVTRHHATIVSRFIEGAKQKGHKIKPGSVKSVSLEKLQDLKYTVPKFSLGKFVIEEPEDFVFLDGSVWDNNLPTEQKDEFEVDKTTVDEYNFSVTAGIKFGAKVGAELEIGVPGAKGTISAELSVETSLSTTTGVAHQEVKTWRKKVEATVPAHYHYFKDVYATQVKGHVPFSITATAAGKARIKIDFTYHGKRTHVAEVTLAELIGQKGTHLAQSGIISGVQGYEWHIVTDGHPLSSEEQDNLPKQLSKWRDDSDHLVSDMPLGESEAI